MAYQRIHDYGIIGDMNSCALVGRNGSIDWACFPRFDSPSVFGSLLDDTAGGRFTIAPVDNHSSAQRYLTDTNVLETTFETKEGTVVVVDFMPLARPSEASAPHEIHRLVKGIHGTVTMRVVFEPRFNYARDHTSLSLGRSGVVAQADGHAMALITPVPMVIEPADDGGVRAAGTFTLAAGEQVPLVAAYGRRHTPSPAAMDSGAQLERTTRIWEAMAAKMDYEGEWRDWVTRSFLALHLLIFEPTGAIVAAPTTSLPEFIGGDRNWDYRFCWLRDAAWTAGVLFRLGDPHEGAAYVEWMVSQCEIGIDRMQILYGISEDSRLEEVNLDHLEGYEGSGPVRIGNDAAFHRQLDVFGEIALSIATYHKYHGDLTPAMWDMVRRMADLAAQSWHTQDRSIWEVRGEEQHFVYSKIMCWVALDRACHLSEAHGFDGAVDRWQREADKIKAEVLERGWSEAKQSFVQHYDTDAMDASALMIPFCGFLPPDDPRVVSTVRRVQRELAEGPFVRRYIAAETDDGLSCDEGAFYMLSFWLIGALIAIGETTEARELFDQVRETASPLGLFAEMTDPQTLQALGNFPQAFSHIGFIHTARNLSRAFSAEPVEDLIG